MFKAISPVGQIHYYDEDELELLFKKHGANGVSDIDMFFTLLAQGKVIRLNNNFDVEEVELYNLSLDRYYSIAECEHLNKRKSSAAGISFWYCPDCKKDVGEIH